MSARTVRLATLGLGRLRAIDWVLTPVAIAIVSRVFSVVLVLQYVGHAGGLPLVTADASPFVSWDGQWYLSIAANGYHALPLQATGANGGHHDFAFYPGWPLLIQVVSLGGLLPYGLTAVLLANLLFVLALVAAYRLFEDRFDTRTARLATLLLAFNPAAYVFSLAYSEPLFLLLTALYFLRRYQWSSVPLAALAVAVRVTGLAIGASAMVEFLLVRPRRKVLLVAAASVAAVFAAWWIYLWWLTGSFTGWMQGTASWSRASGVLSLVRGALALPLESALWIGFFIVVAIGSLVLLRKQRDLAVYCLVALAMGLLGGKVSSMPRYAMMAFPAFAGLAGGLGARWSVVLVLVFAVAEVAFVSLIFPPLMRYP